MALLSRLFQTQKTEFKPKLVETPEQGRLKSLLTDYTTKYGSDLPSPYEPYGGKLTADTPKSYARINPLLDKYGDSGQSRLTELGGSEIEKTLTGDYDPSTSPYYESLRRGLNIEKERGIGSIRQGAQKAGMFESLGRLIEEARLTGKDVGAAGNILARLSENERERRFRAAPLARSFGAYDESAPIRKLSAISEFGGIPSSYEQSGLDRERSEFLRQKGEQKATLSMGERLLYNYNPKYVNDGYTENVRSMESPSSRGEGGGGGRKSFNVSGIDDIPRLGEDRIEQEDRNLLRRLSERAPRSSRRTSRLSSRLNQPDPQDRSLTSTTKPSERPFEGYGWEYKGGKWVQGKLGKSETFRRDLRNAISGKVSWNDLKYKYPDKQDELNQYEQQNIPISKAPGFEEASGFGARFKAISRSRAILTPKVKRMLDQLNTQADLNQFLQEVGKHIKSGNWTKDEKNAVLEYYGQR